MDEATTATTFLASRWMRRRRPAPSDVSHPPWTPLLSVGPRLPCPSSSTWASRWTRRRRLRPSGRRRMRSTVPRRTDGRDGRIHPPRDGLRDGQGDDGHSLPVLVMDEVTTAGAMGHVLTPADTVALRGAALAVSALLDANLEMDDATPTAAFLATGDAVDGAEADGWTRRPYLPSSTRASRWTKRRRARPSGPQYG